MKRRSEIALIALAVCFASFSSAASEPGQVSPATMMYQNREIVTLRGIVAGAAPAERVAAARQRLDSLSEVALQQPVALHPLGDAQVLSIGPNFIVSVFPQDVPPAGEISVQQSADQALANLKEALEARREQHKVSVWLNGLLLALLASVIFTLIILGLNWLRNRMLRRFALRTAPPQDGGIRFHEHAVALLRFLSRVILLTAVILATYVWVTFVLRRFPYTYPWGQALRGFLIDTIKSFASRGITAFPGLFTVFIILFLCRLLTNAIREFFGGIEAGRFSVPGIYVETAAATRRLVNTLVWLFAIIVAYPYFPGSDSDVFKGVSVFVGLMFTLGSAGIMNHLMGGLVLVYSRAFKKGDFIRIGDVEGTVLEIGPLSVKVATKRREEMTIPNNVMTGSTITNYSRLSQQDGLIISTTITIGYDAPWRLVHEMLLSAAARTPGLRAAPAPFVLQTALSDFYVEYRLCVSPQQPDQRILILSELHANIQDAFNERGVQIMSPHFEDQPSSPVLVPKDKWFSPAETEPVKTAADSAAAKDGPAGKKGQPRPRS